MHEVFIYHFQKSGKYCLFKMQDNHEVPQAEGMRDVLLGFIAVVKHHNQKQLRAKSVDFTHRPM